LHCCVYSRTALARALAQFQTVCHGHDTPVCYAVRMSSSYNSRSRAAEVMVDADATHLIRERKRPEALFALEHHLR